MAGRRRSLLLALLALAAPLPALATDRALEPVPATAGPAALSVSTSLDSCGVHDSQIICKLDVSYNALAEASGYTATVTRADGSVVDYGGVAPGGTSLWVPYVGSGTYSVRITAYGDPEQPGEKKPVIAAEVAKVKRGGDGGKPSGGADAGKDEPVKTEAGGRGASAAPAPDEGEATVESSASCGRTAAPAPAPVEPLPPEPPEDLDPANPDEDADGIDDEQERLDYEAAVAAQQAAEAAAAQVQAPVDC